MSFQTIHEVFLVTCERADTPYSLGLWLRFKYGEFSSLKDCTIDPKQYSNPNVFRRDYLCYSIIRKYKGLPVTIDKEQVAFSRFVESETACRETNKRLKSFDGLTSRQSSIFHLAQRKISEILGPFSLFKVMDSCGWSTGASTDLPRRRSFVDTKISSLPFDITHRALPYARLQLEHDPVWFEALTGILPEGPYSVLRSCFSLRSSNRLTVVPKDSSTDRVIAIEPRFNMFLQKGVGTHIRRRLKRNGIDLNNQSINQMLAGISYRCNLATLDLKSASDSVSTELVAQLVPVDWFNYLDDLRSHYGEMPDKAIIRFEKFSSMGNGFTFELESLIFFAIGYAISKLDSIDTNQHIVSTLSVYGDDIVCPQEMFASFVESLSYCGFQTNSQKSFSDGYFFESCGKHFFKGFEVTPIYQKETLCDRELIRLHNRLYRWYAKYGEKSPDLSAIRNSSVFRSYCIPDCEESDDGFLEPMIRFKNSSKGFVRVKVVKMHQKTFPSHDTAFYAYALRKMHARSSLLTSYEPYRSRLCDLLLLDATDGRQSIEVESGRYYIGFRNIFL